MGEDYTRESVDFDCERISHLLRGMTAVSFTLPQRRCIIFMRSPYSYTKTQLEQVLRVFASNEVYQDIKTLVTWNNVTYMYSEQHMDFKYARALAEYAETDEGDV